MPRMSRHTLKTLRHQIPGQLKLRLERMPVSMFERNAGKPPTPYKLLKKSEVLGYTAGYTDRAKSCWKIARSRFEYALKGEKINRHVTRHRKRQDNYTRMEAAAAEYGLSCWDLRSGLAKSDVQLEGRILAELALYEPKTFQSLAEIARLKLGNKPGLEQILRPDIPGIVHRNNLVPNHGVFCKGLTNPKFTKELKGKVPKQEDIPPPFGWRVSGHYPGRNLVRAERYHWFQRPKHEDYRYLPPPERESGGEAFTSSKMGKNFKPPFKRRYSNPRVYRTKPHMPQV